MTIQLTPSSSFTYQRVINDALIDLHDVSRATYDTTSGIMEKLVNDAVRIARIVLSKRNPEMIQSAFALSLESANSGPYRLVDSSQNPLDLQNALKILDENEKEIGTSYRGEHTVSQRTGKPDGWWIEGWNPAKVYVNSRPDKAYAWTLYYIATIARQTDMTVAVPLPNMFREPLAQWVVKFAAISHEYSSVEESAMIQFMEGLLADILRQRRQKFVLKVRGVGF